MQHNIREVEGSTGLPADQSMVQAVMLQAWEMKIGEKGRDMCATQCFLRKQHKERAVETENSMTCSSCRAARSAGISKP
jgi:hypothetical protein